MRAIRHVTVRVDIVDDDPHSATRALWEILMEELRRDAPGLGLEVESDVPPTPDGWRLEVLLKGFEGPGPMEGFLSLFRSTRDGEGREGVFEAYRRDLELPRGGTDREAEFRRIARDFAITWTLHQDPAELGWVLDGRRDPRTGHVAADPWLVRLRRVYEGMSEDRVREVLLPHSVPYLGTKYAGGFDTGDVRPLEPLFPDLWPRFRQECRSGRLVWYDVWLDRSGQHVGMIMLVFKDGRFLGAGSHDRSAVLGTEGRRPAR